MLRNTVNRRTFVEVQDFDYGYAVFAVTHETEIGARTGKVTHRLISCQRLSKVYARKEWAEREVPVYRDTLNEQMKQFTIRQ